VVDPSVERRLQARIGQVTQRERALAQRAGQLAAREQDLARREEELEAAPPPEPEPVAEPVPEPEPEPEPEPAAAPAYPRAGWTLHALELLTRERSPSASPEQQEEWSTYLFFLRDHADADGTLPSSLDRLVKEVFGPLPPRD
jgi:hypothetical protein